MPRVAVSKNEDTMYHKTLLDLRVGFDGKPEKQILMVKDYMYEGNPKYDIFVNWESIGSFEANNDNDAVSEGLAKIRDLLEHLRLDKAWEVLDLVKED